MNKFMKIAIVAVIAVVVIVGGAYMMMSKQTSHVKVIPANAVAVLRVDAKALALKSKYKELTEDEMVKKMIEQLPISDEARKKIEKIIKKPTSTGVNLLGNIYGFVAPINQNEALAGVTIPIASKKAWEKSLSEVMEALGDESKEKFKEDKGIAYIITDEEFAIGWNKKAFLILVHESSESEEETIKILKERLRAKKKESVLADKNFRKFAKKKNDIALWVSSNPIDELYKEELKGALRQYDEQIKMFAKSVGEKDLDLSEMLKNNYLEVALNFNKGAIKATANLTANKKLNKILKKNSALSYKTNTKLWSAIPGDEPIFALTGNADYGKFKKSIKKAIKELEKEEEVKQGLKMAKEQLGMSIEEALLSFKGDFAATVTGIDLKGYRPMPTVTLAFSMKNDKLFKALADKLETFGILKESGDCYEANIPDAGFTVYTSCKKNIFKLSNVKENVTKTNFKKKSLKANKQMKKLTKGSFAAYLNLDIDKMPANIVEMIKSETGQAEFDMISKYAITESITLTSTKKNDLELQLNLKDKKENSLYTIQKISKSAAKEYVEMMGGGLFDF